MAKTINSSSKPSPRHNATGRRLIGLASRHAVVWFVVFCFAMPFFVMVATSLESPTELNRASPHLFPRSPTLANYEAALSAMPFLRYLVNTTLLALVNVLASVGSCALVAYSLAKIRWRGRQALMLLVLSTMMLPPQVTLIPIYLIWSKLGFVGSYFPLLVPQFFGTAFFIFLLRQFFRTIPNELLDAARADGAGEFRIFRSILLPLAMPALATVAVFQFVWTWTDFLNPLLYLQDPQQYTLSIGLYTFFGEHSVAWGPLMAASVLFTIPATLLFLAAQRLFIQGVSLTGFK